MRKNTINLSYARKVGVIKYEKPIEGRNFLTKVIDFIAYPSGYVKPTIGSEDEYGTLIAESSHVGIEAGVVQFTRTYAEELPESWTEIVTKRIRHDEFVGDKPTLLYWKYWSARGASTPEHPIVEPVPPPDSSLPEGASLLREVDYEVKTETLFTYETSEKFLGYENGDPSRPLYKKETKVVGTKNIVVDWGGKWYIYSYPVDALTYENLTTLKRQAGLNYTLAPEYPSTCQVWIKAQVSHDYFILPDGPTEDLFIPKTDPQYIYGSSCISIPREQTTVLESSTFRQVSGALWERLTVNWYST